MSKPKKYVRADFYDIESLRNLFTLANLVTSPDGHDVIEIYYLCRAAGQSFGEDALLEPGWQQKAEARIRACNQNVWLDYPDTAVAFYNLRSFAGIDRLAATFGVSSARYVNNPLLPSVYPTDYRLVCDTDDGNDGTVKYDPTVHPYLLGYNSYNYDTTMLAQYLSLVLEPSQNIEKQPPKPCKLNPANVTPDDMRDFNNKLFEPEHIDAMSSILDYQSNAWIIRKNMLMSGRHLDVARLNEKQRKVGLKRLLGMLGYQILESDKLDTGTDVIETPEQFYDLIAYNVSDIANLRNLFYHQQYQGQFELKKAMLDMYKELIYQQDPSGAYKPNVSKAHVDRARLFIDSSSAQFATRVLCPYGHIKDIETVSYLYPHKKKAEQLGIPQINVLEEAKAFFYRSFPGDKFAGIRAEFDKVYAYYKNIEGKNFNNSNAYQTDWSAPPSSLPPTQVTDAAGTFQYMSPGAASVSLPVASNTAASQQSTTTQGKVYLPANSLSDIAKAETCLHYYDADGNPTGCFVLFSVGGIHGAEYNKPLFDADMQAFEAFKRLMYEVQFLYPNPVDLRKAKTVTLSDGITHSYTEFLKSGKTIPNSEYRDLESLRPLLFKPDPKGGAILNKKYVYTSADKANHEDFVSYYPNLLIQMMALYNDGLGYDRYEEIFNLKQKYGKLMKDKSLPEDERELYRILREGTKLVLNSASGAAAALFENNIRANNQILSMRIIGQLFTWRIGQAQSLQGARIISTNTDGLYSVMESKANDAILSKESRDIHIEIEPEPIYLISKDANNRVELDENTSSPKILSASGGTLGCHKGPNPTKSLAHPAIIDWALKEYLVKAALGPGLAAPFDRNLGLSILMNALEPDQFGRTAKALLMYQNVVASSSGSMTYIFGAKDLIPEETTDPTGKAFPRPEPIILQNYNRIFLIRPDAAQDVLAGTVHLYAAAARAITPAVKRKRAQDKNRSPTEADPLATKVLEANGISRDKRPKDKDIIIKKVTGIDPAWNVLVDNRDLFILPDSEINRILDSLDMNLYLELLDNAYTNNWMNTMPATA